jgi:hypothetical protein
MITSQQTSLLSELRQKPIPEATFIEFEARLQHRIHSMVLDAFNKSGLSQKELADRLGWDTARVSRCLGTSSNWTLRTISALLAAIGVDLDDPSYTSFDALERRLNAQTSAAARPIKRQNRPVAGATATFVGATPTGSFSDLAAMQPRTDGAENYTFLKRMQNASGQSPSAFTHIGEANGR